LIPKLIIILMITHNKKPDRVLPLSGFNLFYPTN
jgi:hypothetical protein